MPRIESFKTVDDDSRYGIFPTNHHSWLFSNHPFLFFCCPDGNHPLTINKIFNCSYLLCPPPGLDGTTTASRICNRDIVVITISDVMQPVNMSIPFLFGGESTYWW